ncbi:MAG: DUF1501 domain-containing protein, partial [Hyphomonadaceae bacterium]|nr:DUF1501 domain-containing protein [Hyphomonadaceae bacterium]
GGYPIQESQNWQSGFLPGVHQGTYIDTRHTDVERLIEHIDNHVVSREQQRRQLDLLSALNEQHRATRPSDPQLGTTHYTVGLISGGVAPNVIPPNAEAEVFFRTVGDHEALRSTLHATVAGRVDVQEILELPAVRLHTVPGCFGRTFRRLDKLSAHANKLRAPAHAGLQPAQ